MKVVLGNNKKTSNKKTVDNSKVNSDVYNQFGTTSSKKAKQKRLEIELGGKIPFFKFPANKVSKIRILPPHKGLDEFYMDGTMHFSLGEEANKVRVCKKHFGKDCPFCNKYDELFTIVNDIKTDYEDSEKKKKAISRKKQLKKRIDKIRPNRNIVSYMIDVEDLDRGIQKVALPQTVLGQMLDIMNVKHDGRDIISDPREGKIMEVKRTGSGQYDTEYTTFEGDEYPVPVSILKELMEKPKLELVEMEDEDEDELLEGIDQVYEDIFNLTERKISRDEELEEEDEKELEEEDEQIDLSELNRKELKIFIKDNSLNVKVYKNDSDNDIMKKIHEEMS